MILEASGETDFPTYEEALAKATARSMRFGIGIDEI
jgi:uncharacterized protein YbcV (DUF1398 family)